MTRNETTEKWINPNGGSHILAEDDNKATDQGLNNMKREKTLQYCACITPLVRE